MKMKQKLIQLSKIYFVARTIMNLYANVKSQSKYVGMNLINRIISSKLTKLFDCFKLKNKAHGTLLSKI